MKLHHPIPSDIKALAHRDHFCRVCAFECLISELIRAIDDCKLARSHGPDIRNLLDVRDYASEFKHGLFEAECMEE